MKIEQGIEAERLRQQQIQNITGGVDGELPPLSREVTYQEVFKDPDNIELNILYARTEIQNGRLDRAQAALERILLIDPEITIVRMLYGLVLFRLDNLSDAEAVFKELMESDISAANKDAVQQYLDQIATRKKSVHTRVTVGVGIHYNNNKTAAPRSGNLSLLNTVYELGIKEKSDWGAIVNLSGETRYDLGMQRPHEAYGKAVVLLDEQRDENEYDLLYGRVDLGATLAMDIGKVDVSVNHSIINLDRTAYMEVPGAKIRWDANPGEDYTPFVETGFQHQLYRNDDGANSNNERNGLRFDTKIGARSDKIIHGGMSDIAFTHVKKNARIGYNSFTGYGVSLGHTQVFDQGRFVLASIAYERDTYRRADAFVASRRRTDNTYTIGITGGAALGSLVDGDALPEKSRDIQMTATLGRSITKSNIINYETNDWSGQLMFSKSVQF